MIDFSTNAKRKLVEGALGELGRLEALGGNFDRWEEHQFTQAVIALEAGAYALAIQKLTLYAKRPGERDRAQENAIAEGSIRLPRDALRQKLEGLRAALA